MKRILPLAALAFAALSLASCARPQPVVQEHHYYHTNTRYVEKPKTSVTYVPKSAGVGSNSPEGFQAVTPPASYSR